MDHQSWLVSGFSPDCLSRIDQPRLMPYL
jgi:hypothetical protein